MFVPGGIFYAWLLADFFVMHAGPATGVMREAPANAYIALGEIISGAWLTTVIGIWAKTSGAISGLKIGAILRALVAISFVLISLGTMNVMTETAALVNVLVEAIRGGVAGGVVGIVLAKI